MESNSQKNVIGVVLILLFGAMMCCGGTLMFGAYLGYDEAKQAEADRPAPDPLDADPTLDDDEADPLRDQFAREVLAALQDAGQDDVVYDRQNFELVADGGMQLNLSNLFAEYEDTPEEDRPGFIARTVRTMNPAPVPDDWNEAAPMLKVSVRDRTFIEVTNVRTDSALILNNLLADDLVETVVYDGPESMLYLTAEHLATWGKTREEVFAKGRENLRAVSGERFTPVAAGVWESPWADNFDTSRAALFDVVKKLKVKGEPVLFLPQRDHLIVTGSNDARGLEKAIELVDERLDLPRAASGRGWKLTAGGLEPWVPEEGSRAAFLRSDAIRNDYNDQKGALDRRFEADGTDVFVATVLEVEDDDEGLHQYCVWTKGAESLLPRTEYVVFVDLDKPEGRRVVAAAKWDDVMARLGGQVTAEEKWWPRRYRVKTFPDVKTLRALGTMSWFQRNRGE